MMLFRQMRATLRAKSNVAVLGTCVAILAGSVATVAASTAGPAAAATTNTCGQQGSFACAHHVYGDANGPLHLVFLGDSYAAGLGAAESPTSGTYNSGPPCYQSNDSYAGQLTNILNRHKPTTNTTLAACNGATTKNVIDTQLQLVHPSDVGVVVSAGGDDINFSKLANDCELVIPDLQQCFKDFTAAEKIISTVLYQRELTLYTDIIKATHNHGTLFVMGYPAIFPADGSTCLAAGPELDALQFTGIAKKIEQDANTLVKNLNLVIYEAANKAYQRNGPFSVDYIDPSSAFAGHNVCSKSPFINGVMLTNEMRSLHPNYNGNYAFALLVLKGLLDYLPSKPR